MNALHQAETHGEDQSHRLAMDRMYRLQRHIYDASRRFYLLGRDKLIADLGIPEGGTVLEVGCGTGRNLVRVSKTYPTARVFGFDISEEMLKSATTSIWKAGLMDRIRIAQGDALTFDSRATFDIHSFDRIYFSYTLSMIPQWREAIVHASGMLAPGGELHVTDFGQCERLGTPFKKALFTWLRQFHVQPRSGLEYELQELVDRHGGQLSFASVYRGYCWHLAMRNRLQHL